MAMSFMLFGSSSATPAFGSASPPTFASASSTSSLPSSPTAVVERDLLACLSNSNFEDSGVDVNLTLAPPTSAKRQCCICDTTITPLWRNGPKGPKSACNACGIKYRKKMQKLSTNLALSSSWKSKGTQTAGGGLYRAF